MLDKSGYEIKIQNGRMKVVSGSLTVLKPNIRNGIYFLEASTVVGYAAVAKEDISRLWHLRLGRVSEKGSN